MAQGTAGRLAGEAVGLGRQADRRGALTAHDDVIDPLPPANRLRVPHRQSRGLDLQGGLGQELAGGGGDVGQALRLDALRGHVVDVAPAWDGKGVGARHARQAADRVVPRPVGGQGPTWFHRPSRQRSPRGR